jgi:uncharacterized protein YoxC
VRKINIAWAALILAVLSLVLNAIALSTISQQQSTISQQQSTIRGLRTQVDGLVVVQEVATHNVSEIVNLLGDHAQILDGLVQNGARITDILNRLVSLVQQGY